MKQELKAKKDAIAIATKNPQLEDELAVDKTSRRRAKSVPREGGGRKTVEDPVEDKKTQQRPKRQQVFNKKSEADGPGGPAEKMTDRPKKEGEKREKRVEKEKKAGEKQRLVWKPKGQE